MLYIEALSGINHKIFSAHVDDYIPDFTDCKILEIQADGHEKEKIESLFPNLPRYTGAVVQYHGEFARFIFENIRGGIL